MQEIAEKLRLVKHTVLLFAHSQNKSQLEFIWPVKFPFSLVPPSKKEKIYKNWIWDGNFFLLSIYHKKSYTGNLIKVAQIYS